MAPVTNLNNPANPGSYYWREIQALANHFELYDVLDVNAVEREIEVQFCKHANGFCEWIVQLVADSDTQYDNMERMPEYVWDYPAGSSIYDLVYFLQDF